MSPISIQEEYNAAFRISSEWEHSLEKRFTEDQELDIMSLIAYWYNEESGFSYLNDQDLYESIRQEDTTGVVYQEAQIGFAYSKTCSELAKRLRKQK